MTAQNTQLGALQFEAGAGCTKERRAEREVQFGRSVPVGRFGVIIAGANVATDRINDAAAKNCVMVMSAEPAELPSALAAITASGFKYKSNICQHMVAPAAQTARSRFSMSCGCLPLRVRSLRRPWGGSGHHV